MPFSLFQPTLNVSSFLDHYHLSTIPSQFPAPTAPDQFTCGESWYGYPEKAKYEDCVLALGKLPSGDEGQEFSYQYPHDNPNRLPLMVSEGTCEIVFTTSGQSAKELDPLVINPIDIRNMAGWIIDQCVKGQNEGGAVTKDVAAATSYILDPRSKFLERGQKMSPSTTYFSLWVWNFTPSHDIWNAGDMDPDLAGDIWEYIDGKVEAMPGGNDRGTKRKLQLRSDTVYNSVSRMTYERKLNWWEKQPTRQPTRRAPVEEGEATGTERMRAEAKKDGAATLRRKSRRDQEVYKGENGK